MEIWRSSLSMLKSLSINPDQTHAIEAMVENTEGNHSWVQVQYTPAQLLKRPRFCNVCREKLSGFPQHGWGCDVCKIKTHRKCMSLVVDKCKWTVEGSIPHHLQYISPENSILPHQWVEGNLPPSARCVVCERHCGSAVRLQDWRCLWCTNTAHDGCLSQLGRGCALSCNSLSCIPPLAIKEVSEDKQLVFRTDAIGGDCGGGSPLMVLVNSKSGDSQGQRMIRKFKRLLNPLQVFDIIATGPELALSLFKSLDSFRVLVCGGDGTVGWVLSTLDKLDMHKQCQLAVLPLGTGNDLARVLGWGHAFFNVHELPSLVQDFERAPTRMLDRWSILAMEGPSADYVRQYELAVTSKVRRVLEAEEPHEIIFAVRSLCSTVRELMIGVTATYTKVEEWEKEAGNPTEDPVTDKCRILLDKLDNLMKKLENEQNANESGFEPEDEEKSTSEDQNRRDSIVGRANSLKKALKDMLFLAEKGIDQHNRESGIDNKRAKFRTKRSKTTPSVLKISSSNVSSSSACSPPASPAVNRDRLKVTDNLTDASNTSGIATSPVQSSSTCTSPIEYADIPESCHLSSTVSCLESTSNDERDIRSSPCIGRVHPPTPGSTREPSATTTGEPDRPIVDDDRLRFKTKNECYLHNLCPNEIKLSHSDSSIYEHTDAGLSTSQGTEQWRRQIKDKKRQSGAELSKSCAGVQFTDSGFPGSSLIAEMLLLNARVLGFSASSRECFTPLEQYKELKVMNNYFGIGLDAKIALDFHNKREGSDKTRSRSKLFLWYGMLGGRELMHRTYRNLENRLRVECDGKQMDLPSLQGLVILNIPSYSGGANFWGTTKEDQFVAQSFDDRLLEVVALFGVMHVATSRVPSVVKMQNHRIAQCKRVRIVILGDEPLPVQVDGEPWMQPPGILQITHKNRAQLLVRNPAFDATLKKWEEQKERSTAPSTPTAIGYGDEPFRCRAGEFLRLIESEIANLSVTSELLEALELATAAVRKAEESQNQNDVDERLFREDVVSAVEHVADLLESHFGWLEESKVPANQPRLGPAPHFSFESSQVGIESEWRYAMSSIRQEISREEAALKEIKDAETGSSNSGGKKKRSRFAAWLSKQWKRRNGAPSTPVLQWSVEDVCTWLGSIGLSQYSTQFKLNDIRGSELCKLERADLKDLGVLKVGHVKRLQNAINQLADKDSARSSPVGGRSSERTLMEPPSINSV